MSGYIDLYIHLYIDIYIYIYIYKNNSAVECPEDAEGGLQCPTPTSDRVTAQCC